MTLAEILAVVLIACSGTMAGERASVLSLSQIPSLVLTPGESSGVVFAASGSGALTLTATSSDQTIVRNTDIVIRPRPGDIGFFNLRITSQPGITGDALITVRAVDGIQQQSATMNVMTGADFGRLPSYQNKTAIRLNDNGPADPYPSTINISGTRGNLTKLSVILNRFWHTFPEDVDLLLVSPSDSKVLLLSDAGGGNPVPISYSITLRFCTWCTDVASTNELHSALYAASNLDRIDDPFPAGAPSPPYGTDLADLLNQSPNGEWKLFAVDDTRGDFGAILDGWTIELETEEIAIGLLQKNQTVTAVIRGNIGTRVVLQGSDDLVAWNAVGADFLDFSTVSPPDLDAAFPNATWSLGPLGIATFDLGSRPPYRFFRAKKDPWPEFSR